MSFNRFVCSALVVALMSPAVVMTAEPSVKELLHARHEHYEKLGDAFKVVRDQTREDKPDLAAIKTAAKIVNDASLNQEKWFPAGSGPDAGKTRARAEIWTKPADFKAAIKMYSEAAPKLQTAANAGDVAAIKTAFGEVGKSCKNCHDQFRTKDKE